MSVTPINVARVSQNLRSFNLLNTVRNSQLGLFRVQNQLATGLRFQAPSDDPLSAAAAQALDRRKDLIGQVSNHLRTANATLRSGESAMQDGVDMLREAHEIALQAANDSITADERKALATVVESLVDSAIAVGNRTHLGAYLFSGHRAAAPPFELTNDGVLFRGDAGRSMTIVDTDLSQSSFTVSGMEFFQAVSSQVRGVIDLDPALTPETRITDLRGTTGDGVRLGRILISDGAQQSEVDLSGAATVGDLLDRLNADMPATLEAVIDTRGIIVRPAAGVGAVSITIEDLAGGQAASDLGLLVDSVSLAAGGADLDPVLTARAALTSLAGGAGIGLAGGLTLRSGNTSAQVSFAGAETVEDALNAINSALPGVFARISSDGRRIEVLNRVSGSDLRVEENGGSAATNLGIRSMYGDTRLADLRDGRGVETLPGDDIRFVTASGATIDVDLDGPQTIQDVIDRFNAVGGGAISASLAATGNGIIITDNTVGAGALRIERINNSPALDGLGLNVQSSGGTLLGQDVNPVRVDGPLTGLLELKRALEQDDPQAISAAGARLEKGLREAQAVQGRLAAMAHTMEERATRIEDELAATRVMLSDVRDVDMTEAIVRFQQLQTALEANLNSAGRIQGLSLLDYLR